MLLGNRVFRWLLLGAIVLLALLLRIYRLDEQSAWADECNFYFLRLPDFGAYMGIMRFWAPDNLPLYYPLLWGWSRVFGTSLVACRMMCIVAGLATVLLAYGLGRRLYGTQAGLLAALCVALSPFQIWHAQSMRPYGLCVPLVIFAFYALERAREQRWWWVAALVSNALLLWLHVLMCFVLPLQCLFVLGAYRHGLRKAVAWAAAQLAVILPPIVWLLPRLANVPQAAYDHYADPGLMDVLVDCLGDDVFAWSSEFPVAPAPWTHMLRDYEAWLTVSGGFLMLCFALIAVASIPRVIAAWRSGASGPAALLGLAFLPPLVLVVLSYLWRPCVETRYTPYSPVALYLLAGGLLFSIRKPVLRRVLLLLLVSALAVQAAFSVPAVSRTQWRTAARAIAAEQTPNDIILVKGIMHWSWSTFRGNQLDQSIPVLPAHTVDAICAKTSAFFEQTASIARPAQVWAVIELPFFGPRQLQEAFVCRLAPLGISGQYRYYPGMEGILLCRFTRTRPASAAPPRAVGGDVAQTDYDAIINALYPEGLAPPRRAEVEQALRLVTDIPTPLGEFQSFLLSLLLAESDDFDVGLACARRAVGIAPRYANGYLALGVSLGGLGETGPAMAAFSKAFEMDFVLDALYGPLVRSLYVQRDRAAAERELARISESGFPFLALRRLFLIEFPNGTAADPGKMSRVDL